MYEYAEVQVPIDSREGRDLAESRRSNLETFLAIGWEIYSVVGITANGNTCALRYFLRRGHAISEKRE